MHSYNHQIGCPLVTIHQSWVMQQKGVEKGRIAKSVMASWPPTETLGEMSGLFGSRGVNKYPITLLSFTPTLIGMSSVQHFGPEQQSSHASSSFKSSHVLVLRACSAHHKWSLS